MSTTSKKHANFVSEPMGDKEISEIAGIGPTYQGRLKDKGFEYVSHIILIIIYPYMIFVIGLQFVGTVFAFE